MTRSGKTPVGGTNWQVYGDVANAIFVDVDTSSAGFTSVPNYVSSLGGNSQQWETIGGSAIYSPTPTGFRVYVRFVDQKHLTPAIANAAGWHIVWIGHQP
ncbi:hypothetical protein [Maioricimonas sp. JC845]|uniref:hypothetical protein n=1 Tax=Maioricimonas sp. JC845 TaxID=3232138 RepID=UPI003458DDFE